MNIQSNRRLVLTFLLIGLVILLYIFLRVRQDARYPSNVSEYNEMGSYRINPETILISLDQGKTNVFLPMLATPGSDDPLLPAGSVAWTQSDYLKIARALHQFVWKESLDEWSVYYLAFDRECQDNPIGFDRANITLYKAKGTEYTLRRIEIYPLASEVDWGGETTMPRPFLAEWTNIDVATIKISADDALQMAEKYGGKDARSEDGNDCRIMITMLNSEDDGSWDVYYYPGIYFEMLIDPLTGKYEILPAN